MEWQNILFGGESFGFLLESMFRTAVMFLTILFCLRALGKRGVTQLSVFELGVIIGLGSAAGDPMFYKDVGILPAVVVFIVVLMLYKSVTWLVRRSDKFERFVEGKAVCVIRNGAFLSKTLEKEPIAHDELLMQLRLKQVSQLGQVEEGILETNGQLSLFFYPDEEVKPGLPILPHQLVCTLKSIEKEGHYACCHCGHTKNLARAASVFCPACNNEEWLLSSDKKRSQ